MPTNKEIFNAKMNALADAINSKAGTTGAKNLDGMKTAVDSISGSGVDTHLYWHSVTLQINMQASKMYAQAVVLSTSATPVDKAYITELISNQGAKIVLSGLARGGSGGNGTNLAYVVRRSEPLKTQWDFMGLVYDSTQDMITPVLVTRVYNGENLTVTDTVNQIF